MVLVQAAVSTAASLFTFHKLLSMDLTPEQKLECLREYMHFWIDGWEDGSFPQFRFQYYLSVRHRLAKRARPLVVTTAPIKKAKKPISKNAKGKGIFLFISSVKWRCCAYCGKPFDSLHVIETVDHIIAKSRGGLNGPKVLACFKCNGWKSDLSLVEFAQKVNTALGNPHIHRPQGLKTKHLHIIKENTLAISRCVLSKCGLDLYVRTQECP